jgi:XTP/dITP diphosphohydrolase
MTPCPLIIATRNSHKTIEIQEILGREFDVRDLSELIDMPEIAETGKTFEENAVLKAVTASQHTGQLVAGDDSGLEVDVLGGAPGIYSARYAGEPTDDRRNVEKLLKDLEQVDPQKLRRAAAFRCVLAIAREGNILRTFSGEVEGTIIDSPRGEGGFGYDPVFVPNGFVQTFGELSPTIKNQLSHRARALSSAVVFLRNEVGTSQAQTCEEP